MTIPRPIEYAALLAILVVIVVLALRPEPPINDALCRELPQTQQPCRIAERGDWYLVQGKDSTYLMLVRGGKVMNVQRVN